MPFLVEGASIPAADDLPVDLKELSQRHALETSLAHFDSDVNRLIGALGWDEREEPHSRWRIPAAVVLALMALIGIWTYFFPIQPLNQALRESKEELLTPPLKKDVQPVGGTAESSQAKAASATRPNAKPRSSGGDPAPGKTETTEPTRVTTDPEAPDGLQAPRQKDRRSKFRFEPIPVRYRRSASSNSVNALAFSPNRPLLATAGSDSTARLWDAITGEELYRLHHERPTPFNSRGVGALAFSPDGKLLATSDSVHQGVRVWNTNDGKERYRFDVGDDSVAFIHNVSFSADGRWLGTASDNLIEIRRVPDGELAVRLRHGESFSGLAFSPDSSQVASWSVEGVVTLWGVNTGAELATLRHPSPVNDVEFSPDRRVLATAYRNDSVGGARLWDLSTGQEIGQLGDGGRTRRERLEDGVSCLRFSPDGLLLVTASWDARLWEVLSRKEIAKMEHRRGVIGVAFSPDGRWLATSSVDRTLHLWDLSTGQEVGVLLREDSVRSVAFSADGRFLAGIAGGTVVLYRLIGLEVLR